MSVKTSDFDCQDCVLFVPNNKRVPENVLFSEAVWDIELKILSRVFKTAFHVTKRMFCSEKILSSVLFFRL